jgi:phosphatidylserine/phosphatidylglycerophosphate/cardiolipin synthase-like enzyme
VDTRSGKLGGRVPALLRQLDAAAGAQLECLVLAHHERRLQRLGQRAALEASAGGWAEGARPPRPGNRLDVLVDGSEALPAIAEAIRDARDSVWLAGWFFSSDCRLHTDSDETLRVLLAQAAEHVEVRLLSWAGAPLPLFHPGRREARAMKDELTAGTKVQLALDAHERLMHCHHEKIVVVDSTLGPSLGASTSPPTGETGWTRTNTRPAGRSAGTTRRAGFVAPPSRTSRSISAFAGMR